VHDLGVQLLGEGGKTDHIGEEDGDRLALPFECAARGENLVGQMLRGIGERHTRRLRRRGGAGGGTAARAPGQTRTLPSSSTAKRWPTMSSSLRSSSAASSSWNWRLRVP